MQPAEIKIITDYPPNIQEIRATFPITENQVFAYHPNIYNPSGKEIEKHLKLHEEVHLKSQEKIGVQNWWFQYLTNPQFRLEEELIAYATQYAFGKKVYGDKIGKIMLHDFAVSLSSPLYGGIIETSKAETKIRIKAKEYETSI